MTSFFVRAAMMAAYALALTTPSAARETHALARMTTTEISARLATGCPTALVYNAGVEATGPHIAVGKHLVRASAYGEAVATQLGDAITVPVIPFAPNPPPLAAWPGTITLRPTTFVAINEDVVRSLAATGFRRIAVLVDHMVGFDELAALAVRLDAEYRMRGVRVFFVPDAYQRARTEIEAEIRAMGHVPGGHGGLWDTSETMAANRSMVRPKLFAPGTLDRDGNGQPDARGVSGDPRGASVALGRRFAALRVSLATAQLRALLAEAGRCRA